MHRFMHPLRYFRKEHGPPTRPVYVVRVGPRYMVLDPTVVSGEFQVTAIFDEHWKWLAAFSL